MHHFTFLLLVSKILCFKTFKTDDYVAIFWYSNIGGGSRNFGNWGPEQLWKGVGEDICAEKTLFSVCFNKIVARCPKKWMSGPVGPSRLNPPRWSLLYSSFLEQQSDILLFFCCSPTETPQRRRLSTTMLRINWLVFFFILLLVLNENPAFLKEQCKLRV